MEKLWWVFSLLRSLALIVSRYRCHGGAVQRTVDEMSAVVTAAAKAATVLSVKGERDNSGEDGAELVAMVQVAVVNIVRAMEDGDAMAAGALAEELARALAGEDTSPAELQARLLEAQKRSFINVWAPRARPVSRYPFVGA